MAGFLVWIALGSRPSEAQYTANFQTNIISGVSGGFWLRYVVGSNTFADVLVIRNKGTLADNTGYVGYEPGSTNNCAIVTDAGSAWQHGGNGPSGRFYLGYSGAGNSLIISNGGLVSGPNASSMTVGANSTSSNNSVLVTGNGSVLNIGWGNLTIGGAGSGNSLVISNGGSVIGSSSSYCTVGQSSSWNRVTITGTGSVWQVAYTLYVGMHESNSLTVANGGRLVGQNCTVGYLSGGSNNAALVTGSGSVWSNLSLDVGWEAGGNSLVISNGGTVVSSDLSAGADSGDSNQVVVTGNGSVLRIGWSLELGSLGPGHGCGNRLVISDGGQVIDGEGKVGNGSLSDSNTVLVAEGGSWQNNTLTVGGLGTSNSVVVAGGSVSATSLVIGSASPVCNNLLELDGGSVVVTNSTHDAVLDVRYGQLTLNGGTVQADILVMTNSCSSLVHTGGTLIVGNVILDPNTFRIVSVAPQGNDLLVTWMMGPGITNALQVATGEVGGSYTTNGFTDIFIVTNNTTVGTVTNYLDIGTATNSPSRYYRARLVP